MIFSQISHYTHLDCCSPYLYDTPLLLILYSNKEATMPSKRCVDANEK